MKKLILAITIASVGVAYAESPAPSAGEADQLTPEERKALFEQRTGGMVRHEAEGPAIVVVDARATPGKVLTHFERENIKAYGSTPGLPVKTYAAPIQGEPIASAQGILVKEKGAMAILIVNAGESVPGLTVCPEDRVAAINADRYGNSEILLLKEIWRTIGFISGVGYSRYSSDPMQAVFSKKDLEAMQGTALLPTSLNAMRTFNKRFGITPAYSMPYVAAVRKGWAPAPTNDVQKAIWEKFQAEKERGPSNPILIPPPNQKK